jgi:Putative zinc-finger
VPRNKITCREFVRLIPAFRDGELSTADRQSFSQHTWKCGRCSDYLKGYELTISAARRSGEVALNGIETTMPESLVGRILGRGLRHRIGS